MPTATRRTVMAFGLANIVGLVVVGVATSIEHSLFFMIGGALVGTAWFAFGAYGGLPLVATVDNWEPPADPALVTEANREGLATIRRRRWMAILSGPTTLALMVLVIPILQRFGQPDLTVLVGVVFFSFASRYVLSRCPRCGYGFFATSTNRAARFRLTARACKHCGLPLNPD